MAAECNNQYCQRCGTWGHGMKMCDKDRNNRPAKFSTIKENDQGDASVPDGTVIVDIDIEGHNYEALVDSGVSVTDMTL